MIRTSGCESLSDLWLRSAQWRGHRDLFVDDDGRTSGAAAFDESLLLATAFRRAGVGDGEVVAFLCRSSRRHATAWFAATATGLVACNLHVREIPERIGETLSWLGARLLVHDADLVDLAISCQAASGLDLPLFCLSGDYVAALGHGKMFDAAAHRPAPTATAAIILSSGTTGRPKGVIHTQRSLLEAAKGGQAALGPIGSDDATLLYMQPSFAAWSIITLPFVAGKAKVCFSGQFSPQNFLAAVERERITMAPLVPTMWRMVFDAGPERYDLSSLKLATTSGEAPAPSDIEKLRAGICANVASLYLSSEAFTGSAVYAGAKDLVERGKIGSCGFPGPGVDLKIIAPEGSFDDELAPGETGEIAVSGPSIAAGYWNDPALTEARFRSGWWRSGDLGRLDEDGALWVGGRIDNMINSGGMKISGEEIEHALLAHSGILQCAVVGRGDPRFGQRVEAFCVARGTAPQPDELVEFLRSRLAGFKIPKAFHFIDEIPTGPTGKIYRRALRES